MVLKGNARVNQRPIGPLVAALVENGSNVKFLELEGYPPLRIIQGFHGGHMRLAGPISPQYVSSILLCAPYAEHEVTLELVGDQVVSQLYVDTPIALMRSFGITVERVADNIYRVPQGRYVCPPEYVIEPDATSAIYPLAIAAITGTTVTIPSIGSASIQGDAGFAVEVLRPMGCEVVQTETSTTVRGCALGTLRPLPLIDMRRLTGAFAATAVLAAVAAGQGKPGSAERVTRIVGAANQRAKDCDRIRAMADELTRFGVRVVELPDGLEITAADLTHIKAPRYGVQCYGDHRIAMGFSVLGVDAGLGGREHVGAALCQLGPGAGEHRKTVGLDHRLQSRPVLLPPGRTTLSALLS
jgi:pentafunctional AROM polypeptide